MDHEEVDGVQPDLGDHSAAAESYWRRRLDRRLPRLAIFPLARVQLFPGALLPLYIFEPRYRAMTRDCLFQDGDEATPGHKILAIATLLPGYEANYQGRPPVAPLAGAGEIVAHRVNPDGTYNLLLRGTFRVQIQKELPPEHLYREVVASVAEDEDPTEGGTEPSVGISAEDTVLTLLERMVGKEADAVLLMARRVSETGTRGRLADVLASMFVQDLALRRQIFESLSPGVRLEALAVELSRLLGQIRGTEHRN